MKPWRTEFPRLRFAAAALALALAALVAGWLAAGRAESPQAASSSFAPDKLLRVGDYIRNEISTGKIPGAVLLIQQHGRPVYFESFGVRDVESRAPMTPDHHLSALFDVEAGYVSRRHDAGRRRQALTRRSRRKIHPGLCKRESRRRKD